MTRVISSRAILLGRLYVTSFFYVKVGFHVLRNWVVKLVKMFVDGAV